jgi:hypothetical protein
LGEREIWVVNRREFGRGNLITQSMYPKEQ